MSKPIRYCEAPGLVLHHECREPRCANPWHLVPMTRKQHLRLHALEWSE